MDPNRTLEAQERFALKDKPKGPIKFKLPLNEEQKEAKRLILANTLALIAGNPGCGKTFVAVEIALDLFFKKEVKKIVITRPTVSKEEIGFLPGDVYEKLDPWMQPIYQNMFLLYDKVKIEKLISEGKIEIVPLSFMRGLTHLDSVVIVDEAQNITHEQMEMIVTRLGLRSKMIICGDDGQIDLKNKKDSGFKLLYSAAKKIDGMVSITLLKNHRNPIVEDLIRFYEEASEKGILNTNGKNLKLQ